MQRSIHNEVCQPIIGGGGEFIAARHQQLSAPAKWNLLRRSIQINHAGQMEFIAVQHLKQSLQPNGIDYGAAFESIVPAEWNEVRCGIQINCSGQMGLIAVQHLNQLRRPNGIYCSAAFESIVPAKWN